MAKAGKKPNTSARPPREAVLNGNHPWWLTQEPTEWWKNHPFRDDLPYCWRTYEPVPFDYEAEYGDGPDVAGRPFSLGEVQITRGRTLLDDKLRDDPHAFVYKSQAVRWLRHKDQGLNIRTTIDDRTILRHIVDDLWPTRPKRLKP
jgi:hypothetical protein